MTVANFSDSDVEKEFISLFSSLSKIKTSPAAGADAAAAVSALHEKLDGPSGVIHFLIPRVWLPVADDSETALRGDNALLILSYLVESRPAEYMSITASAIRQNIEHAFNPSSVGSDDGSSKQVTDALLLALSKLLIGPNSDNQVGVATNAQDALLKLCRWDGDQNNHLGSIAKRVLGIIDTLWYHLQNQQQRESSISQMRVAALMIDISLLGGEEMALALSKHTNSDSATPSCIMDKLLHIALDHPNNDPLLQVSALDQLERLTVHDDAKKYPLTFERAEFLLGHDILRRGLLCLVGSPGDLSKDANQNDEWGEADPINGGAALRLLTEICRVGVSSSASTSDVTQKKFQLLLGQFQRALHNFHPQGELERLSFIYAVSSLVGSCAVVASSASVSTGSGVANMVLGDTALLHEWLSLHSRVSQPKLKSTVLCSLSQVMEPSMWQGEKSSTTARPSDSVVVQLYQAFSQANNERDSTELILASAKSPFVEERLGAYNILQALVMRGVCLRLLLLYDDGTGTGRESSFLEWLLNQELESTSEGKKAKYQIVDAMLACNGDIIGGLLPGRALRQLEEWRRVGPNFMSAVPWEMATE